MCVVSGRGVFVGGARGLMRIHCFRRVRLLSAVVGGCRVGVGVGIGVVVDIGSGMLRDCIVVGRGRVGGLVRLGSWVGLENMALVVVGLIGMVDVGFEMMVIPTAQSARLVWVHCCCMFVDMVVGDIVSEEAAHWYFAEVADM